MRSTVREVSALLIAGITYWLTVYPRARLEIRRCGQRARAIEDPTLRAHALHKLSEERLNPEAATLFAVLAPRRWRGRLVRLMVDFQIAYDYLDAINEQDDTATLRNGLQLHVALNDAVSAIPSGERYYRHHPQGEDSGYLVDLVDACRAVVRTLPSTEAIEPVLLRAVERCGEGQSHNHAVLVEGEEQLVEWAFSQPRGESYLWWELAAAGISCLGIHALFAAAACATTLPEAERIDAAYYPPVCALSALLDSLVDRDDDVTGTNHSFVEHYTSDTQTARRFEAIAAEARTLSSVLAKRARHAVIISGIASFYLSAPEARRPHARAAAARMLACLGATTTPMLAAMRWRRSSRS
jgi:tetraprenyl-beta-curcumene synthase